MVGARRPTVTLALGELAKRGAVVYQDRSWLLLEPAPVAESNGAVMLDGPELLDQSPSVWAKPEEPPDGETRSLASLKETLRRLHEQHQENVVLVRERMARVARARERSSQVLAQTRATRGLLKQTLPPSSE
jgi:hypothetical protein